MILNLLGHDISEEAQKAGEAAIARRRHTFYARQIGREIQPYITPQRTAWPEATPERVADAVAEVLIWQGLRAGTLRSGLNIFGSQYYRPVVRPVRLGGA